MVYFNAKYFGVILLVVFALRMLYRLLVIRDLRDNPDELYIGLAFCAVWAWVYFG